MENILRWISFVPGSFLVALIIQYIFLRPFMLGITPYVMLELSFPRWTILALGLASILFDYIVTTIALLLTAYWIIPSNKKRTVKIYSIVMGILIFLLSFLVIYAYFLGHAGYLWPILGVELILGYSIGVFLTNKYWIEFYKLSPEKK